MTPDEYRAHMSLQRNRLAQVRLSLFWRALRAQRNVLRIERARVVVHDGLLQHEIVLRRRDSARGLDRLCPRHRPRLFLLTQIGQALKSA